MSASYLIDLPEFQLIFGEKAESLFLTYDAVNTQGWTGYTGLDFYWLDWTSILAEENPELFQYWVGIVNQYEFKPVVFINYATLTDDESTEDLIDSCLEDMKDFIYADEEWLKTNKEMISYSLTKPVLRSIRGGLGLSEPLPV